MAYNGSMISVFRHFRFLLVCFLSSSIGLASAGPASATNLRQPGVGNSPCSLVIARLGQKWPLERSDLDDILRGNNRVRTPLAMGTNGLSFLAAASHLRGIERAELWEGLVRRIPILLPGSSLFSSRRDFGDPRYRVYQGPPEFSGQFLAIDLQTGQMWRGACDPIDASWTFENLRRPGNHLRRLGEPSVYSEPPWE